jgi:amino acid efflux transporter
MTARLRSPHRQLPRVIALAFVITTAIYLGLACATVGVLGQRAGSATPVADLLRIGIGPVGALAAAVAAVALTLAATNAYLSGAAEMVAALAHPGARLARPRVLPLGVAAVGIVLLVMVGTGWVTTTQLVVLPTTMFVTVYATTTAAGVRLLTGRSRLAAAVACAAVGVVLAFTGVAVLLAVLVVGVAVTPRRRPRRRPRSAALARCPG